MVIITKLITNTINGNGVVIFVFVFNVFCLLPYAMDYDDDGFL